MFLLTDLGTLAHGDSIPPVAWNVATKPKSTGLTSPTSHENDLKLNNNMKYEVRGYHMGGSNPQDKHVRYTDDPNEALMPNEYLSPAGGVSKRSFISLDVETNGLDGLPYAVAMRVYRRGVPGESICFSCPIQGETDQWLIDNPHLIEVDGSEKTTYADMMRRASDFYLYHSCHDDADDIVEAWGNPDHNATPVLYHCGMVVEGGFFYQLKQMGLIGKFQAPMAPIEVADALRSVGENPNSVDAYVEKHRLPKASGATHNPMYDAIQAATVYLHIVR